MSQAELLESLSEQYRKHLDPSGGPARMMAARGMAPLPPRELFIVLCGLSIDPNEGLADSAAASLGKLPEDLLAPALEADLPAAALSIATPHLKNREPLLEKILLNQKTPDDVIASVAAGLSESLAEIVIGNQERCLRSEAIISEVRKNGALPRASLDRMFDFLVRSGVIYDEMPEFAQAMSRLSVTEMASFAEKVELPPGIGDFTEEDGSETEQEEERRVPMLKLVAQLTAAQKVALALKGNREARTILIRDSNRVVAAAAVRNPRLSEAEVLSAAQNRSLCDEVIRIISNSREMVRPYPVKLALVYNPKTPLAVAMRFLNLLRAADVRTLAKSKGVPQALAKQAQRLASKKKGR